MAIHVVLYQPEIPANTGNISRTCAATDSYLHLIKPLGFSTDDKHLKRAGIDYWEFVKLKYYDSLDDFLPKMTVSFIILRHMVINVIQMLIIVMKRKITILCLVKNQLVYRKIY